VTTPEEPSIKDFESALTELEALVSQLEDGSLSLEQSLQLFERGVKLSRYCHSRLEEAEQRLEVLTKRGEPGPAPDSLREPGRGGA
jgi:exodeoxyribonuclease VII small subunit